MGYGLVGETQAEPLPILPWMQKPGALPKPYDTPSRFEAEVIRRGVPSATGVREIGTVRTPHHLLTGTITPNGLHYTRLHTGVPDIDPSKASAGDPWTGQAASGFHGRTTLPLPARIAHLLSRVRR